MKYLGTNLMKALYSENKKYAERNLKDVNINLKRSFRCQRLNIVKTESLPKFNYRFNQCITNKNLSRIFPLNLTE